MAMSSSRAGSRAMGEIVWRTGRGAFGKSGKMEVALRNIELDGRRIPLEGHLSPGRRGQHRSDGRRSARRGRDRRPRWSPAGARSFRPAANCRPGRSTPSRWSCRSPAARRRWRSQGPMCPRRCRPAGRSRRSGRGASRSTGERRPGSGPAALFSPCAIRPGRPALRSRSGRLRSPRSARASPRPRHGRALRRRGAGRRHRR